MNCCMRISHGPAWVIQMAAKKTLGLAYHANALMLLMSLSWPMAA